MWFFANRTWAAPIRFDSVFCVTRRGTLNGNIKSRETKCIHEAMCSWAESLVLLAEQYARQHGEQKSVDSHAEMKLSADMLVMSWSKNITWSLANSNVNTQVWFEREVRFVKDTQSLKLCSSVGLCSLKTCLQWEHTAASHIKVSSVQSSQFDNKPSEYSSYKLVLNPTLIEMIYYDSIKAWNKVTGWNVSWS